MRDFQFDVFLSHNAKDKPRVRKLAERLKAAGLRVWFDEWNVRSGDIIALKVDEGLEQSRVLLLCISPNALASDWVALERSTAVHRDPANEGRRFIPLLLADCELPDTLRRYKYLDLRQEPEVAFKELLAACRPPTRVLVDESQPAATGNKQRRARLLIDQSHRQHEWHGYPTADAGYKNVLHGLDNYVISTTAPCGAFASGLLSGYDVLLLPMPFGSIIDATEYQAIAQWVYSGNGLMLLGNYLMEGHHHTNFNQLARIFGLEFSQDLVMPPGHDDFRSCIGQAFGTRVELHTIVTPVAKPVGHPVVSGVRKLGFQSSCTVLARNDVELAVTTKESFGVMRAVGPKDATGKIQQIQDYVLDKRAQFCFMAGATHGTGRILAIGSWKIFLNEFTDNAALDNRKLFQNAIAWLTPRK